MIDIGSIKSKPEILPTTSRLSPSDYWDHWMARIGVRRGAHRIDPGLYALGNPGPDSQVFVTANYTLSFDALRVALHGLDCYFLVLDTQGINVWCAAGKGTFSTNEIVLRVLITRLNEVVRHRKLILPQLGAPGVAAHEVKKRTTFGVEYGPVRAAELPEYLKTHMATVEMRKVRFTLQDRLVLIPVDFIRLLLPMLAIAGILYFVGGILLSLAVVATVLAGTVLFPILLPWLPSHDFSMKGFILGGLVALPFSLSSYLIHPGWVWWQQTGQALGLLLAMPAVTAFIALNFTGSSTYTSRSGVRREMYRYIPAMAWTFGTGIILTGLFSLIH
jgi:hypothetical protein